MVSVAIFDYGAGNIFSLKTSLEKNGATVDVISSFDQTKDYVGVLLPGVGNFDPAIRSIRDYTAIQFKDFVQDKIPVLGICLGMQLFFKSSEESKIDGLGWIDGSIKKFNFRDKDKLYRVPHMGWNNLEIKQQSNFLDGVKDGSWVYFVHSYRIKPKNSGFIVAETDYGIKVPAVIEQKNFIGTQFHPEKSGEVGSLMLRNFLSECKK